MHVYIPHCKIFALFPCAPTSNCNHKEYNPEQLLAAFMYSCCHPYPPMYPHTLPTSAAANKYKGDSIQMTSQYHNLLSWILSVHMHIKETDRLCIEGHLLLLQLVNCSPHYLMYNAITQLLKGWLHWQYNNYIMILLQFLLWIQKQPTKLSHLLSIWNFLGITYSVHVVCRVDWLIY